MTVKSSSSRKPDAADRALRDWLVQQLVASAGRVQLRLRGNILHVLCETSQPLERAPALLRLVNALLQPEGRDRLQKTYPQVYQLYLYSRRQGAARPDWTAPIYLNRLERHQAQLQLQTQDPETVAATQAMLQSQAKTTAVPAAWTENGDTAAIVLSHLNQARQGDPEAIAWYLSEVLSALDVGVWVSIRAVPGHAQVQQAVPPPPTENGDTDGADRASGTVEISRLWVLCEAAYSPDPALIAEPVAERLRQLELTQFKDAVIVVQIQGETHPDWSLRVDLTPPSEMLAEWARWGDSEALVQLLDQALAPLSAATQAESYGDTVHLIVQGQADDAPPPSRADTLAAIAPLLERLAPQGLLRAMVYGQRSRTSTPDWVRCLTLPAAEHPALATPPQTLAQQGDLPALTFLLTRQLNPDLTHRLNTGGIRIQLLLRQALLHVMADGPMCPPRRQIVPPVIEQVQSLAIPGIEGVRIYGRRAGQQRPAWSYGTDFQPRDRIVPEAEAEFAASESYLGELLAQPEAEDLQPELSAGELGLRGLGQVQRWLLRSHLFMPQDELPRTPTPMPQADRQDALKIGLVWGLVGVLVAVQADWLLGQMLTPSLEGSVTSDAPANAATAPPRSPAAEDRDLASPVSQIEWDTDPSLSEPDTFTDDDFIAGDRGARPRENATDADNPDRPLAATPDLLANSPYPSFRSQQLNEKLALYHQRLQESGPPDVVIIGSSRALRGVDPATLRRELSALGYGDLSIFNFGVNGATAQVVDLTLRRILSADQLPRLIVWADGARAFNSGRVDVTYNAIATSEGYETLDQRQPDVDAESADADVSETDNTAPAALRASYQTLDERLSQGLGQLSAVYPQRDRLKTWVAEHLLPAVVEPATPLFAALQSPRESAAASRQPSEMPLPANSRIDFDGFLPLEVRFNPATYYQRYARVSGAYDSDYEDFELRGQQSRALKRLLDFTQAQEIPVVFVNTPLTDEYLDSYRLAAEADFQKFMLRLAATESDFIFRDLGQIWPDRYDYFSDPSHLNRYGASQVSRRLARDPMIPWPSAPDEEIVP